MVHARHLGLLLIVLLLVLTACADDEEAEDTFPDVQGFEEPTATVAEPAAGEPTPTSDTSDAGTPTAESGATDDVFNAGEAGEVEIRLENGDLVLVEVRPFDGWDFRIDEEDDDEVQVDFSQTGRTIDFDSELEDGRLEIDVCDTVVDPTGDVYTVGEAGEVEARLNGDELDLVEVRPNDGWDYRADDEDDDEIEVDFRSGDQTVEFTLEYDEGEFEARTCTHENREMVSVQQPAAAPAVETSGDRSGDDHKDDDDHRDDDSHADDRQDDDNREPPGQNDDRDPPGQDNVPDPPGQDDDWEPPGQDDDRDPPGQGNDDKDDKPGDEKD